MSIKCIITFQDAIYTHMDSIDFVLSNPFLLYVEQKQPDDDLHTNTDAKLMIPRCQADVDMQMPVRPAACRGNTARSLQYNNHSAVLADEY